ncbi:MAG: MFS transporter [Candidatus Aenigmarchaeota archaeon]|nr:MFS transporter [Candidatus Aenigmarchaeota archaeon]
MENLRINFFIYCIANFIWSAVFNLWYSFLPKYYEVLGASTIVIGFLFSLERVSEGFSNIFGGHFADKAGRKKVIIIGSFLGNISLLILYLAIDWIGLIPAIALFWVTVGIQFPTITALINESLPKKRRASALSVLSIMSYIPGIFTVSLGGLLMEKMGLLNGLRTSLLISFVIGILSTFAYIFFLKETLTTPKKFKIKLKWGASRRIWCFVPSYSLLMFSVSLISPFVIFYSQDIKGIGMLDWGIARSFFTAFTLIATIAGGLLSDRFGRKTALLLSFISILFPFSMILSRNLTHIIIAHIFASALFLGSSTIPVYVFEKSKSAKSIGMVNFCLAIAMVLGYPVGGFLYSLSPEYPFMISGLIRILGLIIGVFLI